MDSVAATFLYEAGEAIREKGKPAFIYVFTDHDRDGYRIAKQIENGLHEHAPDWHLGIRSMLAHHAQFACASHTYHQHHHQEDDYSNWVAAESVDANL